MPIAIPNQLSAPPVLPSLIAGQIDAARLSQWYPSFTAHTAPSTVIHLSDIDEQEAFQHWLESDSIFLPEGSEARRNIAPPSPSSPPHPGDDGDNDDQNMDEVVEAPTYQLPKLTQGIWEAIRRYGAVFPKLNWTAPRDAAFMVPQTASGPLHCTSPADVYLLLKSSDLVSHGLDHARAYEPALSPLTIVPVELVLRKYIPINPSMEFRCFVRNNLLIGVSQRDGNYYRHLQEEDSQDEIAETIRAFWEDEIRGVYAGGLDYIFDVYLTSPTTATLVDFNPYRASTDSLLFSYSELRDILEQALRPPGEDDILERLPIMKVVEQEGQSRGFEYGTNMVPLEMVQMSQGQTPDAFAQAWQQAVQDGLVGDDSDSE